MSKSYKKVKEIKDQLVIMSRIDFEIAKRVYERMQEIGMNDEEFSFLLGKRNKYFFDLLDPTEKNKFKTEQLDYIPTILDCSIRDLVPNEKHLPEQIKINASKINYDHKIVYNYSEINKNGTFSDKTTWTKKIAVGNRKAVNPALLTYIQELLDQGRLNHPLSALYIYLEAKNTLKEITFTPTDLQKCLSVLMTSKGKHQVIQRVIIQARYYYRSVSK